jgi:hypothetical protein
LDNPVGPEPRDVVPDVPDDCEVVADEREAGTEADRRVGLRNCFMAADLG